MSFQPTMSMAHPSGYIPKPLALKVPHHQKPLISHQDITISCPHELSSYSSTYTIIPDVLSSNSSEECKGLELSPPRTILLGSLMVQYWLTMFNVVFEVFPQKILLGSVVVQYSA